MAEPSETCVAWGLDGGVHEARNLKPMLTPEEQVELLKAKGVTFECCDERAAIEALTRKNTFMHLAACRRFHGITADALSRLHRARLVFA